jgi:ribosomal-protein-alanine N-acetyltransferase
MEYTVRAARAEDAATLLLLEEACFRTPWREGELASHLASPTSLSYLCEDGDGTPVGYLLGLCLPPEGELYRVAVPEALRGRGLGRLLLERFLSDLDGRGADVCFLEVRASNAPAIALYRSVGFLEVGVRKKYYKDPCEDALVLRRG